MECEGIKAKSTTRPKSQNLFLQLVKRKQTSNKGIYAEILLNIP